MELQEVLLIVETGLDVVLVDGLKPNAMIPVPKSGLQMGNVYNKDADIKVNDPYVSRKHAMIVSENGVHCLVDTGSTNGTYLNGDKLATNERKPLRNGDRISLGHGPSVTLRFSNSNETIPDNRVQLLRLSVETQEVFVGGRTRKLTTQEFRLLELLDRNAGRVCTFEHIGETCYSGEWEPNTIQQLIRRLRMKIEPDLSEPRYILNVPSIGYMLAT